MNIITYLHDRFTTYHTRLQEWFATEWQHTPPPVYGSVDLRRADSKIAPIDMNLFPAGFHHLSAASIQAAIGAAKHSLQTAFPGHGQRILLIPENHTRNTAYWNSLATLQYILEQAGFHTRIGVLETKQPTPYTIQTTSGATLWLDTVIRQGAKLVLTDFMPDFILLNHDLSAGVPALLQHLQQVLLPPIEFGWHQRSKSTHFQHYSDVTLAFAKQVDIDPWLITPLFCACHGINFLQKIGIQELMAKTTTLLDAIGQKYQDYRITAAPFVMIKADAGTYGMAVMTVHTAETLATLNRKQRTHMNMRKGKQVVDRVIIQEGIYTHDFIGHYHTAVAEPTLYLWGKEMVGGFYRLHHHRGIDENLNTPGMHFQPLTLPSTSAQQPAAISVEQHVVYQTIAQLSMLAAAREMVNSKPMTPSSLATPGRST